MNVHEYQAKSVLAGFGVPVPRGHPAFKVEEAVKAAEELGGPVWVVKAQIHAGGRGKAGGVKVVKSIEDVRFEAQRLLGSTLVTHQTGPQGKEVHRLYVEEAELHRLRLRRGRRRHGPRCALDDAVPHGRRPDPGTHVLLIGLVRV